MLTLTPTVPPSSPEAGAFALLAVLADPVASQKRLDELVAHESAARKAEAEAKALIEASESSLKELETRQSEIAAREKAVAEREASISAREATWEAMRASINTEIANIGDAA